MIFPLKYDCLRKNVFKNLEYKIIPIRFEDRLDIMNWRNEQMYHLRQVEALSEENQNNYFKTIISALFQQKKQIRIPIGVFDTGNDLLQKYKKFYFKLVLDVVSSCENKKLRHKKQNEMQATYFGKRTPSNGKIDWNWQKERIYNWVRAQSNPYPGAFTFFENKKIIIDQVKFSNIGFSAETENGIVLENDPNIIVKTPNGALQLTKLRTPIRLKVGCKLN